jgi:hypothetical protein
MLRHRGIANPRQHIGNGISCHSSFTFSSLPACSTLPAGFHHSGNFSLERVSAETYTAHFELADISARPSADPAAVADADLEFRLPLHFCELTVSSHASPCVRSLRAKWHAKLLQQLAPFFVRTGRGGNRDVHALDLVHSGVINLWKHQLVLQTERVISAPVE